MGIVERIKLMKQQIADIFKRLKRLEAGGDTPVIPGLVHRWDAVVTQIGTNNPEATLSALNTMELTLEYLNTGRFEIGCTGNLFVDGKTHVFLGNPWQNLSDGHTFKAYISSPTTIQIKVMDETGTLVDSAAIRLPIKIEIHP